MAGNGGPPESKTQQVEAAAVAISSLSCVSQPRNERVGADYGNSVRYTEATGGEATL